MDSSLEYVTVETVLSIVGGSSVVLCALFVFLGRIMIGRVREKDRAHYDGELKKLEADLSAKLNALEAKNEPVVHVHKMQFEKEFTEYQELWRKTVLVDGLIRKLRKAADDRELYGRLLDAFEDDYGSLVVFNLNSHPFYYVEIYRKSVDLGKLIESSYEVLERHGQYLLSLGTEEEDSFSDYKSHEFQDLMELRQVEIGEKILVLSKAIRDRWHSMCVVENAL